MTPFTSALGVHMHLLVTMHKLYEERAEQQHLGGALLL